MSDEQAVMGLGIVLTILCTILSIFISHYFLWGVAFGIVAMLIGYFFDET
jgi:hypothetical protein